MIRIIVLAAIVLSASGAFGHPIEGTWQWRSTTLESGGTIDPTTEGLTRTLIFNDSTDDLNFYEFHNGEIHIGGLWWVGDVWVDDVSMPCLWVDVGSGAGDYLQGLLRFEDGDETMIIENFDTQYFDRGPPVPTESGSWGEVRRLFH